MLASGFIAVWRFLGLLAWPILWLHPRARVHMTGLSWPTPGRTWLHGASLGEHQVVEALRDKLGPVWVTHSSWRTPVEGSFPAPLDLVFVIGPWLDRARPGRIVLVEGELWPGWIAAARKRGIPVSIISARKGSGWHRWQRVRPFFQALFGHVQRLEASQFGDLKALVFPVPPAFEIPTNTIIGASTRAGDEKKLLAAWVRLPKPRPLLVLAPRRLERVEDIEALCALHRCERRTQMSDVQPEVLILDTFGELSGLVAAAHTVFIGGTFDAKIGGHSPIESALGGAHLVAGPHRKAHEIVWKSLGFRAVEGDECFGEVLVELQGKTRPGPQGPHPDFETVVGALPGLVWQPERRHRPYFWLLSPVWGGLSYLYRRLFLAQELTRPTVLVGGLVAGGAGRTPVVGWLAEHLPHAVVLGAGYRRKGWGRDIRSGGGAKRLGDELEMMSRRGHRVISAPSRPNGIASTPPGTMVIIDGGLSDRRLASAFRICVIDAQRPLGGGPIPVGSQRLPWSTLDQVNAIWLSHDCGRSENLNLPPNIPVVRSHLVAVGWLYRGEILPLSAKTGPVDVVVGIATPERFLCTLLDQGIRIRSLKRLRDHGELGEIKAGSVMTEKDAARLPQDEDVWALRMDLVVEGGALLLDAIASHRR